MIIRKVKLQNILSHEDTEVEFPDGVTSIVGPNGAGKSSIVDSIYIALFSDVKPDIRGGKKEFIVMKGRNEGRISVVFEVGGKYYIVERDISVSGPTQARLYEVDGNLKKEKARGVPDVVGEVCRMLRLPTYSASEVKKLVRATIFSIQDELTEIIDIEDSKRKEWILSLLGLSYLEKALENVKKVVREEISRLEGEYDSLRERLDREREELIELEKEIRRAEESKKSLSEKKEKVEKELRLYEEKIRLIEAAADLALSLRSVLIAQAVKELENKAKLLEVLKNWDTGSYTRLLRELSRKREEQRKAEEEYREQLDLLERAVGVSPDRFERYYEEIEERNSVLKKQEGEVGERVRLLREILSKFELSGRCPICGSIISDSEAVRKRLSSEISSIEEELRELKSELATLQKKKQILTGAFRSIQNLSLRVESAVREVKELGEELKKIEIRAIEICRSIGAEFQSAEACIESLDRLKADAEKDFAKLELLKAQFQLRAVLEATLPERLREELVTALSKLGISIPTAISEALETSISSSLVLETLDRLVNVDLRELRRELEKNLNDLRRELGGLENKISVLEGSIESKKEAAERLRRDILEAEKNIRELEKKIGAFKLLEGFSSSYLGKDGNIAKNLTKAVRVGLERKANRILSELRLPSIKINEDFQISLQLHSGEVPIKNASGGERVGISLALRLALAEIVMGRLPTALVVDEPTVYLDSERREQIFHIIRELGKSLRQLIIVTHDDSVTRISDKVVLVESFHGTSKIEEAALYSD
ncbi:MAG: SMC family ATPase [Sulfolobales archaeon]|nr:SMC family ATPase [Sulfolobales archaeon]MDW8082968.1 SMC family ATPase [Sulfolobales archaeon]